MQYSKENNLFTDIRANNASLGNRNLWMRPRLSHDRNMKRFMKLNELRQPIQNTTKEKSILRLIKLNQEACYVKKG